MLTNVERKLPDSGEHFCCVYAGRRDEMGNHMFTAKVADVVAVEEFIRFVQ